MSDPLISDKDVQAQARRHAEDTIEFWYELHKRGIPLSDDQFDALVEAGKLDYDHRPKEKEPEPTSEDIDQFTRTVIEHNARKSEYTKEEHERIKKENSHNGREIKKSDWKPENPLDYTPEFIHWVNSINSGFGNMVSFEPFELYCQQAFAWLTDPADIRQFKFEEDKRKYAFNEFNRCRDNSLYALDKYLKLKDGKDPTIVAEDSINDDRYESVMVHRVIAFIIDAGYSFIIGKPRQIAATTTIGAIFMFKVMFQTNTFVKFITMDKDSGEEIFEDKMKFAYANFPMWAQGTVSNDTGNYFQLKRKTSKGRWGGANSKLRVVAPSVSAINGGSPTIVGVDEVGYIRILDKMIKEARPTLFGKDKRTGKLKMKRQLCMWGTGGDMDAAAGPVYEEVFRGYMDSWNAGDYSTGIVPFFFDWTTRPGITQEFYEAEKLAYSQGGGEKFEGKSYEERMSQFKQHYPSVIDDMFITSEKTIMSGFWVSNNLERLKEIHKRQRPKFGKFVPIFDYDRPIEHSDVDYFITGARFEVCDDEDIPYAPACIMFEPKPEWRHRYFMGIDPIQSDNGYSNMAAAIWDKYYCTIPAYVNTRHDNHKETFLQTFLMALYFNTDNHPGGVPQLLEMNAGTSYSDYVIHRGYEDGLVHNTELPDAFRGGRTIPYGIDNHGQRSKFIVAVMKDLLQKYGERFMMNEFFYQIRTYVCTVTERGTETWGTKDAQKFHDDLLYAAVFAYICGMCFDHLVPFSIKQKQENQYKERYVLKRDANGNLTRELKKTKKW